MKTNFIYRNRTEPSQIAVTYEVITRSVSTNSSYVRASVCVVRETDQNKIGVTPEIKFPSPLTKDIT